MENKNELMEKNTGELDINTVNNLKRFTTVNLESEEGKAKIYNSLQRCDVRLIDIKGQDIEIEDIYIEGKTKDEEDEKTGEVKTVTKYRTILYGTNGMTYVSTAYGIFNSIAQIIRLFGYPTPEKPYKLRVSGRTNKNGTESLILTYIHE